MARFVPQDADFCYALVHGENAAEKRQVVCSWLKQWLSFQVRIGNSGVVVFDIDDTLVNRAQKPFSHSVDLYAHVQNIGLRSAIVTARPESKENRKLTISTLRANGFDDWESLFMMTPDYPVTASGISSFKRDARDSIEQKHRILANVGDMWHDVVRLPLYGPMKALEPRDDRECAVFFPFASHGEVAVKFPASEVSASSTPVSTQPAAK